MIYETRMTVTFIVEAGKLSDPRKFKTTLIEYINADSVEEAFDKAAKHKHEIIISIAKGESDLFEKYAWGRRSKGISISLDAVVAKPDINIKDISKRLKIKDFYTDNGKERIELNLSNGTKLRLSKPALETLLESFK